MSFVGRSVPRLEDRAAGDRPRPVRRRCRLSAHAAHARGALGLCAWPHRVDRRAARRWRLPGVVAVWTSADVADIPPIDFRLTRIEGLAPYRQPILAQERVRYVGEPVAAVFATDPYRRGGRRRSGRGRDRGTAGHSRRRCRAGRVRGRPFDRAGGRGKGLRRRRRGVPRRACRGRARSLDRAPFRRAAGNARRHRALRRRPRRAGDARRRQGAALESRQHRAHARRAIPRPCICTRAMSAAASASAASSIPRTCWSASPRCGSAGR